MMGQNFILRTLYENNWSCYVEYVERLAKVNLVTPKLLRWFSSWKQSLDYALSMHFSNGQPTSIMKNWEFLLDSNQFQTFQAIEVIKPYVDTAPETDFLSKRKRTHDHVNYSNNDLEGIWIILWYFLFFLIKFEKINFLRFTKSKQHITFRFYRKC